MKGLEGELQKDLERIDALPAHWRTASVTAPILRSGKHAKRISLLHISLMSLVYFANPTRCALPSAAGGAAIINTMMNNILQITSSLSAVFRSQKGTKLLHTSGAGACPGDGSYYY